MDTWEYHVERVHLGPKDEPGAISAALDALGADGWEAVGFSPSHASSRGLKVDTDEYVVLLKRKRDG